MWIQELVWLNFKFIFGLGQTFFKRLNLKLEIYFLLIFKFLDILKNAYKITPQLY